MSTLDTPPASLRRLAAAVDDRLTGAGVQHTLHIKRVEAVGDWWRLAVVVEDGVIDDLFGVPGDDLIGVVPEEDEWVPVDVATEYVAMCVDLVDEVEWAQMLERYQRAERQARRDRRRSRLRSLLRRPRSLPRDADRRSRTEPGSRESDRGQDDEAARRQDQQ